LSLISNWFGGTSQIPKERLEGRPPRGLRLLPHFVTDRECEQITAWIAERVKWSCGSFQGNRMETYVDPRRPLPEWGQALGRRMREARIFAGAPDYLHLISYTAGSGLRRHVDRDELGEVVAGLTLGSSRVFEFAREGRAEAAVRLLLMLGDLYVISGDARHRWEHGVPFTIEDHFGGGVYPRRDGISATWRCVVKDAPWIKEFTRATEQPGSSGSEPGAGVG
jgi:alkylated DNA repair dioxygenase AlkB